MVVTRSGIRFFEQAHIKDVTSYMRVLVNPRDELAWRRLLIMYPKVGKATFNKIWQYLKKEENPLKAVLKDEFIKAMSKAVKPGLEECRKQ